jgi:hypothetical protein
MHNYFCPILREKLVEVAEMLEPRRGVTTVFRANPVKLEVVAMNNLGEPSHAIPAISDGQVFLRTDRYVYCIGEN